MISKRGLTSGGELLSYEAFSKISSAEPKVMFFSLFILCETSNVEGRLKFWISNETVGLIVHRHLI
jgi:hypothetical protein